jgi:hypothetical protein
MLISSGPTTQATSALDDLGQARTAIADMQLPSLELRGNESVEVSGEIWRLQAEPTMCFGTSHRPKRETGESEIAAQKQTPESYGTL